MAKLNSGTRIYGNTTIDTWLTVGYNVAISGANNSTSNSTGALVISRGGLGVVGNVYTGNVIITGTGNGITFVDGTVQTTAAGAGASSPAAAFTQANAAFNQANAAFVQANSASAYANAINLTQNTSITASFTQANAAFAAANSAIGSSAVAAFAQANAAFAKANTAFLTTGGTITGNVRVDANVSVNGTFSFANSTNANIVYTIYNSASASLDTYFG